MDGRAPSVQETPVDKEALERVGRVRASGAVVLFAGVVPLALA